MILYRLTVCAYTEDFRETRYCATYEDALYLALNEYFNALVEQYGCKDLEDLNDVLHFREEGMVQIDKIEVFSRN